MNWNHCLRYLVASIIFLACLGSLPTTPGNMYSKATASTKKNSDGQSADSELDRLAQEMGRHFQKKRCGVVLELGKELHKEFKNQDDTNWEKRLELYLQMAMCYWVTGNYASMDDYFEKTIEFIRQTAEKEGEAYCHCDGLKMVADLYRKLNLYDRAEKMYLESLRETEKIRGPTHKSTIALLDALVEINLKRLDYTNARQYLERSVALTAKRLGDKDQKAAQKRDKLLALESAIKQSQPATDTSTGSPQPSIFVQTGHTEDIHSVAFNTNGKFAVTAGGDNLLKLWEVSSGREIRTFRGHEDTAFRALFVPGGQYMLSGSFDKTLRLWELVTGREVRRFFGHHGEVLAMAVSADGKLALSGGEDKTVILWDLLSGKKIRAFYGHKKWVVQVGFFEGGNRIFSSGGKFIIWDPETGKKLAEQASTGRIYAGGARFAKYSKGNISIGEPSSGNVIKKIKIPKPAWGDPPIVNNVGTLLAYSRHKGVDILDINSGNVLYAFETQSSISNPMAFSPDGRHLLIGGKALVLYDLMNGRRQWSSRANTEGRLLRVALDSAEKRAYIKSDSDTTLKDPALAAWDLETGRRIFKRKPASDALRAIAITRSGKHYYAVSGNKILYRDMDTGKLLNTFPQSPGSIYRLVLSPHENYLVAYSQKKIALQKNDRQKPKKVAAGKKAKPKKRRMKKKKDQKKFDYYIAIWETTTAKEIFSTSPVRQVTFAMDESFFAVSTADGFEIRSLPSGEIIHAYRGVKGGAPDAISPDSRLAASTSAHISGKINNYALMLWDLRTHQLLKKVVQLDTPPNPVFTADNKYLLYFAGKSRLSLHVLDLATLRVAHRSQLDERFRIAKAWNPTVTDKMLFRYDRSYNRFADNLWHYDTAAYTDIFTGKTILNFEGHDGQVMGVAPLSGSGRLLSVSFDKTMRLWDTHTGKEICRFYSFDDGEWLVMTPAGFFNASQNGAKHINVSIGMQVYSIDQFHDILYRPDLIEARLKGDPEGLFARALEKHDLSAILSRGAAPQVTYMSPRPGQVDERDVNLEVKLTDRGGGFGKVVWKLNGITRGVADVGRGIAVSQEEEKADPGQERLLTKRLTLSPGVNRIECIAYNRDGRIAAAPEILELVFKDETQAQPDLHLLTIGINRYRDRSLWLNFAVPDAKGMALRLNETAGQIFKSVHVTEILDQDARVDRIADVFKDLAKRVSSNDIFIFYLSGHGVTLEGQYHFLPADFRYHNEDSIREKAINQDMLQRWLGQIAAEKNLVLLDTCNSGAFIQSHMATRGLAEKTAIEKLNRATGRAIIAASSDSQVALEGYRGHGVFTYTLLKALVEADEKNGNRDGLTSTTEMAAYVGERVPEVTYQKWGYEQVPQILLHGNEFPVGIVQ